MERVVGEPPFHKDVNNIFWNNHQRGNVFPLLNPSLSHDSYYPEQSYKIQEKQNILFVYFPHCCPRMCSEATTIYCSVEQNVYVSNVLWCLGLIFLCTLILHLSFPLQSCGSCKYQRVNCWIDVGLDFILQNLYFQ